ncbi:MAG TPA: transposase [Firmicutes bacterium]|nr:transposase [Bacillota bacterium]
MTDHRFIAGVFEAACEHYGVEHERIPCRTPNKNAHIEAFHRILEDECLAGQEFETFTEKRTRLWQSSRNSTIRGEYTRASIIWHPRSSTKRSRLTCEIATNQGVMSKIRGLIRGLIRW